MCVSVEGRQGGSAAVSDALQEEERTRDLDLPASRLLALLLLTRRRGSVRAIEHGWFDATW